jgi:hypothetical protein
VRAAACTLLVACSFHHGAPADEITGDGPRDTPVERDGTPDAPAPVPIYATDAMYLYTVDVVHQSFAMVGMLHDSGGNSIASLDSFAYVHGTLVAIGHDGPGQSIGTIDRTTALVTFDPAPLATSHLYYGATYDDSTNTIFAASNDDAKLYRVNTTNGTTTAIGPFGGGLTVYGDIAWLGGTLYGTMTGGVCNPGCLATIDTTTGAATVLSAMAPGAVPSLATYDGALYGFAGNGDVFSFDLGTGAATMLFNAGGKDFGDAAP